MGKYLSVCIFPKEKLENGWELKSAYLRVGFGVHYLLSLENNKGELLLKFLVLPGGGAVHIIRHSDRKVIAALRIVVRMHDHQSTSKSAVVHGKVGHGTQIDTNNTYTYRYVNKKKKEKKNLTEADKGLWT